MHDDQTSLGSLVLSRLLVWGVAPSNVMDLNTSRLECSVAPSQNTCLCLPQHTSTRFGAMDHNPPSIPAVDAVCPINDNPSPNSTQGEDNTHAGNGGGKGGMQPEEDKREPEEVQEAPVEVQEEVQVAVDPPIMEDEDESEVVEALSLIHI